MHRLILAAILAVFLFSVPWTPSGYLFPHPASAGETYEWAPPGNQYVPRTDGRYVVWLDGRGRAENTHSNYQIFGADLTTGEEFEISTGDRNRLYPDVDQGVAVWAEADRGCSTCRGDIVGKMLASGETFIVSSTSNNETRPAITNGVIVWVEISDVNETLWMKNLFSDDEPTMIAQSQPGWEIDLPRADDNKIVWSEFREITIDSAEFNLRAYDILTGKYYDVGEGFADDRRALRDDYDIDQDVISWAVNRELFLFHMPTETTTKLLEGGGCPTIEDGIIFYEDFRYFEEEAGRIEVWGYDIASGARFHVGGAPGEVHEYANVNNGVIAWQFDPGSGDDIIATSVANVLPTKSESRTSEDSESYRFFEETQHPLTTDFLAFWDTSGGLPVFGFPLTSEYSELNADLGEPLRVQYLERQRFEHHPDLAGTPYEVLIGRLGFTAAERAGLLDSEPFQPLPADTVLPAEDCVFFNETGHTVCGRFLSYWQGSGLEFGDEGVTFRESLALFGLPLSEEFVDPETGFVSQYFERAIFEYHPENDGTEFEVLLRRLGVEELQARGWCSDISFGCDAPAEPLSGYASRLR